MKRCLQCDRFQAFSNMEETQQPWSSYGCLFLVLFLFFCCCCPPPPHSHSLALPLFDGRPDDATFLKLPVIEINLLSITLECKDYSSCDLKERKSCIALSIDFSQSKKRKKKDLCMPPLLPEEMQCVFLAQQTSQITG